MKVYYSNHLIRQEKVRFFWHLTFLSRIRDPGSGMTRKVGSGINIPDPQHCCIFDLIFDFILKFGKFF
jgi:hypothetical protein